MVYRNNAGKLGAGFISVCLETRWLGQNVVSMCRNDPVRWVLSTQKMKEEEKQENETPPVTCFAINVPQKVRLL